MQRTKSDRSSTEKLLAAVLLLFLRSLFILSVFLFIINSREIFLRYGSIVVLRVGRLPLLLKQNVSLSHSDIGVYFFLQF